MKKLFLMMVALLALSIAVHAQDVKTYQNKAFSIEYPANWQVTWDGDTYVNIATDDDAITFSCTFNEMGPTKSQLKEAVDNWVYMTQSNGATVDQKLVKDDYALVRSIMTDDEDGTKTVTTTRGSKQEQKAAEPTVSNNDDGTKTVSTRRGTKKQ